MQPGNDPQNDPHDNRGIGRKEKILAAGACVLFAASLRAGRNVWTTTGPPGGARVLAVDPAHPATVYAMGGGFFRSDDGGASWNAKKLFLSDLSALALAESSPSVLYAGSRSGGVFKTVDRGETWQAVNAGLSNLAIGALAVDPTNASTVYAGTDGAGIFRTANGGQSWARASAGLPDHPRVTTIAVDPRAPSTVYASILSDLPVAASGMYKSVDGGSSWMPLSGGDPLAVSILVDPGDSRTVYALDGGAGVFKSGDGGTSWSPSSSGLPSGISFSSLAVDPATPSTLYVGLYEDLVYASADSGATWAEVYSGPGQSEVAVAAAADGSVVYLADIQKVARSIDGGASWTAQNIGLADSEVRAIAVGGSGGSYAGAASLGLFQEIGGRWMPLTIAGISSPSVRALAVDPSNPQNMYAGVDGFGVFESTDAGGTWSPSEPFSGGFTFALAVDPVHPPTAYAANIVIGADSHAADVGWVARTLDGGATWSGPGPDSFRAFALAIESSNSSVVYAAGEGPGGIFRSVDSGAHWTRLSTGLEEGGMMSSVALDPGNPAVVYAAIGSSSTQWGVLKTVDSGSHWTLVRQGLPAGPLCCVLLDPRSSNVLYAGTHDAGVFRSGDGGKTWQPFSQGFFNPTILSLAFDSTGSRLSAGTAAGFYEISLVSLVPGQPSEPVRVSR